MNNRNDYNFGGRIQPKTNELIDWTNLVDLPNKKMAFIYQRLSTHEQVKKHLWSIEAQDDLMELAHRDGYSDEMIYLERRDLGISGTKGREERPGLEYLIQQVEAGLVEAVYVVHISRLYRDQTLINALALGELFKEHNVIIVTPQMRLNLKDKMHMRLFRMEVERAADELDLMVHRLNGAKDLKAKSGRYGGECLPTGYILDELDKLSSGQPNPNYHTYHVYEPHAEVVRLIFEKLAIPGATATAVARYFKRNGINFPPFPPELDTPANHKSFSKCAKDADGNWYVTVGRIRNIATNPAYIGYRLWNQEIISEDMLPPIVDESLFWAVQERFDDRQTHSKEGMSPLPLAGILYCGNHEVPRRMYHTNKRRGASFYHCTEFVLNSTCTAITAFILDNPISEAVISQVALPGLAARILQKLSDEYEQAKEEAASYRREMKRLETEVENLRSNMAGSLLSSETVGCIEKQIQERLSRIRELASLETQPIGAAIGHSIPDQDDIELVKAFLENLGKEWAKQPDALKHAFLRLLLDQVIIRPESGKIYVTLIWRIGLKQELVIYRPTNSVIKHAWDATEEETLEAHYETATQEELLELLPGRTWRAIRTRAKELKLYRSQYVGCVKGAKIPRYTPEEDELIKHYYAGEIGLNEVLQKVDRSIEAIENRAWRLGMKLNRNVRWEWINCSMPEQDDSSRIRRVAPDNISRRAR